jgi:signal transduction histidine kinase/ActR/RegA family two-component response regulator
VRLADFIRTNLEPILAEWEVFARSIWPEVLNEPARDPAMLRDHAEDILRAAVTDMISHQSGLEQSVKSKGDGHAGTASDRINSASEQHGTTRVADGFELWAVVAEYRALRASVIRLWGESGPTPDRHDLVDLTRFNESIDQSLTEAVRSYTEMVDRERDALVENEHSARKEAEGANRAKDMFLATLSHEMRTPLSAIVGWISIMRLRGCGEAEFAEGLDVIERNTQAQVKLIEDVLDVSRIVSGKLRLEISDCDLKKVISAGIDVVRPTADARDITLEVHLGPTSSHALCDAARIQQVVWNLLSNAIKFTPKGGAVGVRLARDQSAWLISVDDNGQGISEGMLPFVFDRFRQGDSGSRRSFGGLGLGLSIVKHLTEMHGGTVEAHSAGEGHGSTFVVRLPIRAVRVAENKVKHSSTEDGSDSAVPAPGASPPPIRLDGLRILIVDDEADARRMLSKVLEGVGARISTASSAVEALAILDNASKEKGPDVLLSDVGMPDQNGYDLIREVRRRGHYGGSLPAVALTAFAHGNDAREATSAGFEAHLAKPANLRDLTAALARITGR